jgi:transposase, IS5 family
MRIVKDGQLQFGEVDISRINFDLRARDELPKLLMGLQHIFCTPELRSKVFDILEEMIPAPVDKTTGRPGMELWKVFVLGMVKLNCHWDYDKLLDMANNHQTLRLLLGQSQWKANDTYALQTLKDNVRLFTPEVLDKINQEIVKAGHALVGHGSTDDVKGRCDSFVVETDVHYPTDINLLFDAIRKLLVLLTVVCGRAGIPGWRQSPHNIRKLKKLFRKAQKMKRSTSKNPDKQAKRQAVIEAAHEAYVNLVESFLEKVRQTIKLLRDGKLANEKELQALERFLKHAERQIDQIRRRVLQGEVIPHDEKVFSVFEEHTEWICKGKAGVPQELGLRVCVLEDQYGFVLHHHVMQHQTDDAVTLFMVRETQQRFSTLSQCSFDKGFYTPENRQQLEDILNMPILPKKGRLSKADREREFDKVFVQGRQQHSAVESGLHALENHGLDRCPDHGLNGFLRYVALAVVARNLQIVGHLLQQQALQRQKRSASIRKALGRKRQEASP